MTRVLEPGGTLLIVNLASFSTAGAEAGWIMAADGTRLHFAVDRYLEERAIPAEFVGLSGLLQLPEVVEVLAYARAVADSRASVALARILLGPRYRLGFKDLARVAAWAKDKNYAMRSDEDDGEAAPFLFAEALEHLGEVEGLSDEARSRLEEFRTELASLRDEARRPVEP